ncbi:hypothetical protein [Acanthopleuribacter pedis]|uniref:Uncharacterized protein n=1 Tax=Acanthopleuribacter pedis TaxID=442870 RepID=A0A8J7U6W5_9BACT|nr:hypothetical protein [Acanthopleuribacter pedis]MBO1320796.1 hypothetical protein [Acanthopleuribacter pedis]
MSLLFSLITFFWMPPTHQVPSHLTIWEQIAEVEGFIKAEVNKQNRAFGVFSSDPVRGYYLDEQGVMLFVPVRYKKRSKPTTVREQTVPVAARTQSITANREELNRRKRQWRETLQQDELEKEAAFEELVTFIRNNIPKIGQRLPALKDSEQLTVIVEEREPAWYFAGLHYRPQASRKLVTLRVTKSDLDSIKEHETDFPGAWIQKIKRTNNHRDMRRILP